MGVKLIILLGLVAGVLYCLHLLAQDFIAIRMPKFLRFLGKRDLSSKNNHRPHVRWKMILHHDPLSCARLLYCGLGAGVDDTQRDLQQGLAYMLTLQSKEEDASSLEVYREAYEYGRLNSGSCRLRYPTCPFPYRTMLTLLEHMINNNKKP